MSNNGYKVYASKQFTKEYVDERLKNIDLSTYETKEDATNKLEEAKTHTNTVVNTHDTSTSAHSDIRNLITGLTTRLNTLADSDDTTLDQMSEVVAYIKSNKGLIESITTAKISTSDIVDNLTTADPNKVLSANMGVVIKGLIDALQDVVNGKANASSVAYIDENDNEIIELDYPTVEGVEF